MNSKINYDIYIKNQLDAEIKLHIHPKDLA